jgi:hypothetical protein
MDEYNTIVSVGELMVKEKVLTDIGLRFLHNDIFQDLTFETNEQKTRAVIYMTIVVNMVILYGGYVEENKLDMSQFNILRKVALKFMEVLPNLLKTLSDKYLETFHGAKVAAFVHGKKFDDFFPLPPEEQKLLDSMQGAKEVS